MRLLNVHDFTFSVFEDYHLPQYVIASHKWCGSETTYQDVQEQRNVHNDGYRKVQGFVNHIRENLPGIQWLWIDTCCIDKKDAVERDHAINSMFEWYRGAELCLAYLKDVACPLDDGEKVPLVDSIWFTRGWTLQELVAPATVVFLSRDWQVLGHKGSNITFGKWKRRQVGANINTDISIVTGIAREVLLDYGKSADCSDEEKWAWTDGRQTTRPEDMSYCLLGIFDVTMNIRYGGSEGGVKTRQRLESKIRKRNAVTSGVSPSANNVQDLSDQIVKLAAHISSLSKGHNETQPLLSRANAAVSGKIKADVLQEVSRSVQHLGSPGTLRRHRPKAAAQQVARIKFRASWLTTIVWDLAFSHAKSGWDVSLRMYNVVPHGSKIMKLCREGDLSAMQKLVASGEASWLDCGPGNRNLLEQAAQYGHYDLCQYMLEQTAWPDQMSIMWEAVEQISLTARSHAALMRGLQVFFQDHIMDVGEDWLQSGSNFLTAWKWCDDEAARQLMLKGLSLRLRDFDLQQQYALAVAHEDNFEGFESALRFIELHKNAFELRSLRAANGASILHEVASALFSILTNETDRPQAASLRPWIQLGIDVLRSGLDPHHRTTTLSSKSDYGTTALTNVCWSASGVHFKFLPDVQDVFNTYLSSFLRTWMHIIEQAGLDPHTYTARENEVIAASNIMWSLPGKSFRLLRVVYHYRSRFWTVETEERIDIDIMHWHATPGTFLGQVTVLPKLQIGSQKEMRRDYYKDLRYRDDQLGRWTCAASFPMIIEAVSTPHEHDTLVDPACSIIDSTQDDNGCWNRLFLTDEQRRTRSSMRERSHSAPRLLGLHARERYAWHQSDTHPWMAPYHLCPRDFRRRACWKGFIKTQSTENFFDCMTDPTSASWPTIRPYFAPGRNFLREIAVCQTHTDRRHERPSSMPMLLAHSHTPDCPQGCHRIRIPPLLQEQLMLPNFSLGWE